MIAAPKGKTMVTVREDSHQCNLKKGDEGYIDGHLRCGDGRPYAVVVRLSDGAIDYVAVYNLTAT